MSVNLQQTDTNKLKLQDGADGSASAPLVEIAEFGRGASDKDITYIALRNASGTLMYVYPNSGATGLVTSTTAP